MATGKRLAALPFASVRDLFQNRPEKQSTSSSFTLRGHSAFLHLSARHCAGRGDFGSDLRRVIKR
ncbi:MAG: hypothetical protein J0H04_05650 [Hyphomicrobium denitrificans]|nr:hypothetical protein [Hyphomicrobium denitrificans]